MKATAATKAMSKWFLYYLTLPRRYSAKDDGGFGMAACCM